MRALPTGTVTFLFTDIEGSTRLWEQYPEAMQGALARHDALLQSIIEANGGVVFKNVGDAVCAAFDTANEALVAAIAAQRGIEAQGISVEAVRSDAAGSTNSPLLLKVRMGLHTGAAQERDGDYFGSSLNRVARLLSTGHGEQILMSLATQELVRDALPVEVGLKDLGQHRLKDLQRPEHIFQTLHPALASEFPPLRSLDALPNNLSHQLSSFVGREKEMEAVKGLLKTTPLLTLTGSGGCGKTRLALQVAADLLDEYRDGVWQIELAAIRDPALVEQAIAASLGLVGQSERPLHEVLLTFLRDRSLLLLLDNCEHLLTACAHLTETLLRACPTLRILATSQAALGVNGERTYRVPSLSLPDLNSPSLLETLTQYEAVRLFIERAVFSQPNFAVTNANAPFIAQICHRLDGIPLAIELAAARIKALPPEQIASRLDDRFKLLTGGSRTALPRQKTLRALIDWSHDLLNEQERSLLRRLSVLRGSVTLEAVEAICADAGGEEGEVSAGENTSGPLPPLIEAWEVLDLLTSLVDKSLVSYEDHQGEARYFLLETVRQYGQEKLKEMGQYEGLRRRHLAYFLSLAQEASIHSAGLDQKTWMDRLEREQDNLRAALEWCLANEDQAESGLRLAASLSRFWYVRGYVQEGRKALEHLLASCGELSSRLRADALCAAGHLARLQDDNTQARLLFEKALLLYRDYSAQREIAETLNGLSNVERRQNNFAAARQLCESSLALYIEQRDRKGIADVYNTLGKIAYCEENYDAARRWLEECLALYKEMGYDRRVASTLNDLRRIAYRKGEFVTAYAYHCESLRLFQEQNYRWGIAYSLTEFAICAAFQGRAASAARIFGAVERLREVLHFEVRQSEKEDYDRAVASVQTLLGEELCSRLWAEGRAWTPEQAIACVFAQESAPCDENEEGL